MVIITFVIIAGNVTREIEPAAFNNQVIVATGGSGYFGEVVELPGDVTDDAAFFFDIKEFFSCTASFVVIACKNADAIFAVFDGD